MSKLLMTLLLSAAVLASAPIPGASAQTPEDTKTAREAYGTGQGLFRQGDFRGAQAAFEEAYQAVPNPIVLLGISEAQQRLGLWSDAAVTLTRYLKERPDAPDKAQVEGQLAEIQKRPGEVSVETSPPGAVIAVDGTDVDKMTPATLELVAGEHRIAVTGAMGETAEQVVTVTFGGRHSVNIDLAGGSAEVVVAEQGTVDEVSADSEASGNISRTAAWVAVGVGGAGLVMGGVLGGLALKERKSFDDDPTEGGADKGEAMAIFADVGFGIAVAGALTAAVLFATSGGSDDEGSEEVAWSVSPAFGRRGGGVATQLRF
jgi:hypothetical protein